jgi:hypothetical protein
MMRTFSGVDVFSRDSFGQLPAARIEDDRSAENNRRRPDTGKCNVNADPLPAADATPARPP